MRSCVQDRIYEVSFTNILRGVPNVHHKRAENLFSLVIDLITERLKIKLGSNLIEPKES